MLDELNNYNFSGVDNIISTLTPDKLIKDSQEPDYNFAGVDSISSAISTKIRKSNLNIGESNRPESSDWNISKLNTVEEAYNNLTGKKLPVVNRGQGAIHNKWGLDHTNSADIGIDPSSKEGQQLISYLKENNIPFLSFNGPVPGQATGKHIHIGLPSKKIGKKYPVGTTNSNNNEQYDFSGTDSIDESSINASEQQPTDVDKEDISQYNFDNTDKIISGAKGIAENVEPDIVRTKTIEFTGTPQEQAAKKATYKEQNRQKLLAQSNTNLADLLTNGVTKPISVPLEIRANEDENITVQRGYYNAAKAIGLPDKDAWAFAIERQNNAKQQGREGLYQQFTNTKLTPSEKAAYEREGYTNFTISDPDDLFALNDKAQFSGLHFMGQDFTPEQAIRIKETIANSQNAGAAYRGATEGAGQGVEGIYNTLGGAAQAAQDVLPNEWTLAANYLSIKITGLNPTDIISNSLYKEGDIYSAAANILRMSHPDEERNPLTGQTESWAPLARDLTGTGLTAIKLTATAPLGFAQLPLIGYFENRRQGKTSAVVGAGFGLFYQVTLGALGKLFMPIEGTIPFLKEYPNTLTPSMQQLISNLGQSGAFTTAMTGIGVLEGQPINQAFIEAAPFSILPLLHGFGEPKTKLVGNLAESTDANGETKYGGLVSNQYGITFQEINKSDPLVQKWLEAGGYTAKLSSNEFNSLKTLEDITGGQKPEINPIDLAAESKTAFLGNIGKDNLFTNQETTANILNNFFKVSKAKQGTFGGTLIPYGDVIIKKSADAAYVGAFFIEDFYHRGIEPTVDLVLNKLRTSLGEFGKDISDDAAKVIFEKGMQYYRANQADPFFSKMKQDANEKLPNRFSIEQARNILSQHKNELEWTAGLEDFLKENEGKKISKKNLVDVIQRGQVRVEESVADETKRNQLNGEMQNVQERKRVIEANPYSGTDKEAEYQMLQNRETDLLFQLNKYEKPQYSLKAYPSMQLELPGAENSKEVKLIAMEDWRRGDEAIYETKFPGQHSFPDNTVAHYRSNDRTTTDNIPINFGEEFQSDWNQAIQDEGVKLTIAQRNNRIFEINKRLNEIAAQERQEEQRTGQVAFNQEKQDLYEESDRLANDRNKGLEPNPFMGNTWKELVLKRFLRDSVIAKDENGNYKYNGIGWTTARQQQERYNKLLASTELRVHRVSGGTDQYIILDSEGKQFGEPTNNLLRAQESARNLGGSIRTEALNEQYEIEAKNPQPGTFVNIPNAPTRGTLEEWEPIVGKEYVEKIRNIDFDNEEGIKGTKFDLHKIISGSELTFGGKGYADYDNAYKNILIKLGKRFGAGYSQKEINTGTPDIKEVYNQETGQSEYPNLDESLYGEPNTTKVHFLEITPSMRQSLEKEGLPLYGLGSSEKLKNPETGIRNRITSSEAFDGHRNNLVNSILAEKNNIDSNGTAFNSGLPPDAFLDFVKLSYQDFKDFTSFSKELLGKFGDAIKPYIQDLWIHTKDLGKEFKDYFDVMVQDFKSIKDTDTFKMMQSEKGAFNILGLKPKTPEKEALDFAKSARRKVPYYEWYSLWRNAGLAQLNSSYGEVSNIMRGGQRLKNSIGSFVLGQLQTGNENAISNSNAVAETIWIGNQFGIDGKKGKTYTDVELANGDPTLNRPALTIEQIKAYKAVRAAEDANLYIREQTLLVPMREKANNLNAQLLTKTAGTPEHDAILNKLLDLDKAINNTKDHFQELKDTGYISTQRRGTVAAFAEDPNFPAGDVRRKLYRQFNTLKEASDWLGEMRQKFGAIFDPATAIYDIKKPENLRTLGSKMTPGQFEDLIDSAGVDTRNPEVQKLRDEIYSSYPSMGYQLQRDFTRGYDRSWQGVLDSVTHQTDIYTSSYYSKIVGEEALRQLDSTGLRESDYSLYQDAMKYIDHEISSPQTSKMEQRVGYAKKATFIFQLAYDMHQLYLHGVINPIMQTNPYFARVEVDGVRLKGTEPEQYFTRAIKLSSQIAKDYIKGTSSTPTEFQDIYDRLKAEHVITPEFTSELLDLEADKTTQGQLQTNLSKSQSFAKRFVSLKQQEHWAGVFVRAGQRMGRTHAAAEAYLVGKEKFNLEGEQLVDFIVKAVDSTQANFSRAEHPLAIRGEQNNAYIRKLFYQFNTYKDLWLESFALNVKADLKNQRPNATIRQLAPLALTAGIRGLPLAGVAGILYTLISGNDPKKVWDKIFGNDTLLENMALNGVTGSAAFSSRLSPKVPIIENLKIENSVGETATNILSGSEIPVVATAGQIAKGFEDLADNQKLRAAGELIPIKPLRSVANMLRYKNEGARTRTGTTIIPRSKITIPQQIAAGVGFQPNKLIENYDNLRTERLQTIRRNTIVPFIRKLKRKL